MKKRVIRTYFLPNSEAMSVSDIEELISKYVQDVDDRTKAEMVKALVELHKAELDASDKNIGRRNELIKILTDLGLGVIKTGATYVILGNCLAFETTGVFTSPISKLFVNKVSNIF